MAVKMSSVFLPHSLACFLDFLSIVFVVEHCELKKKMDHRKYAQNLIFQSRLSCWFWEMVGLVMTLKWRLRSSLSFCRIVSQVFSVFPDRFFSNIVRKKKGIIENILKTSFFKLLYIFDSERYLSFSWL